MMAPARKECTVVGCDWEGYAMHLPRHLLSAHGIGAGASKREEVQDPSVPDQSTAPRGDAGSGSGLNAKASQDDRTEVAPLPEETAPRKPKLFDRLKNRRGRGHDGGRQAPVSGEKPPKRPVKSRGRRVPLDVDISDVWGFAGRRLENTPHFATGRMLQYQAPAAGLIIDRAVAGTLPDRLFFQPLARNRDKYEDVGFLLMGPMLTFAITSTGHQMEQAIVDGDKEKFDELAGKMEFLKEAFTWVASMMLPRLAEGVEKAREEKAKKDAAIKKAFPDLVGEDPIETFANMVFTPPIYEEAQTNGRVDHAATASTGEGPIPQ